MSWKVGMPNLGHTMEEGKVAEWIKRVGDPVSKGEVIAVVESDKASFDVESPADGTLLSIDAEADSVVPVGATIGTVGAVGEVLETKRATVAASPSAASAVESVGAASAAGATPEKRAGRVKISPAARALAEELDVDPQDIAPTGDDGMVTRDDVRAHAAAAKSKGAPASGANAPKPFSPMRRAIADATSKAWQTIPAVALHSHADVGALADSGVSLTAAVGRACALALAEHPGFNGWMRDSAFEASASVNLALAVSTPDGLVAAVVPGAQTKSIAQLGDEIRQLAESARAGKLEGARMLGGTFTISTLGRWGVDSFAPIISAPQVASLGVGRVDRVAREGVGGQVRFASEVQLTLVFDHRPNDGVEAARLLASIVGYLENPKRLEVQS